MSPQTDSSAVAQEVTLGVAGSVESIHERELAIRDRIQKALLDEYPRTVSEAEQADANIELVRQYLVTVIASDPIAFRVAWNLAEELRTPGEKPYLNMYRLLPLYLALFDVSCDPSNWDTIERPPVKWRWNWGWQVQYLASRVQRGYAVREGSPWDLWRGRTQKWTDYAASKIEMLFAQVSDPDVSLHLVEAKAELYDSLAWWSEYTARMDPAIVAEFQQKAMEMKLQAIVQLDMCLQADSLEPADILRLLSAKADMCTQAKRYEEALNCYERLRLLEGDNVLTDRKVRKVKGLLVEASLPIDRQLAVKASRENLKEIGLALHRYADAHRGFFPSELAELVRQGYLDREDRLTCPITGVPFEYMTGVHATSKPDDTVLKAKAVFGLRIYLRVDGAVETVCDD